MFLLCFYFFTSFYYRSWVGQSGSPRAGRREFDQHLEGWISQLYHLHFNVSVFVVFVVYFFLLQKLNSIMLYQHVQTLLCGVWYVDTGKFYKECNAVFYIFNCNLRINNCVHLRAPLTQANRRTHPAGLGSCTVGAPTYAVLARVLMAGIATEYPC